ncbi:TPR domain-containing glycosyltransferase [Bacillus benzoevorans]|uniref:Glycosyltransferase involved in cell wall biosynthesis n=1 Tax=Bacillus benzoevorans TaxID=1456 RepID=A0A7X0LX42_9BACI|nr:TPR domain-containing glycosyltransferase [Bacillus benzoevorans]MBB6447373.1 glycosyltransferase involved in cell wall biosynthesis [Bacillus benzoevorans]
MSEVQIGIQIIIKNEAELLPQCLESVQGADEIIVVDTGSTDNSSGLAESFGAKVVNMPWQDSFSDPRNEALRHANTDWILYLDADERLVSNLNEVREFLQTTNAEAFTVLIDNKLGPHPEECLRHRALRIFRNGQGYKFRGRIHEDIGQSIVDKCGSSIIKDSPIRIDHYGYLPQILATKNKVVRNEKLLKKELADHPNHPFYLYNMGITYCQAGQLEEAKAYMQKALIHTPDVAPYRATLIRDLSKIMLQLQEVQQAEMLLRKELLTYPDYSDLCYLLGESLEMQGHLEAGMEFYQRATEYENDHYVMEAGINSYRAFNKMAETALLLGHRENAARWFHKALLIHNTYVPSLHGIAEVFQQLKVPDKEISLLLHDIVRPHGSDDYVILADALYKVGAFQEVVHAIPETQLSEPRLLFRYTAALMQCRNYADADQILSRFSDKKEDMERLFHLRSICQWQLAGHLHEEFAANIPESIRGPLTELDRYLTDNTLSTEKPVKSKRLFNCVQKLIHEAVSLQCFDTANRLAVIMPEYLILYAKELYYLGKTLHSADLLLELFQQNRHDEEVMFMIGELLFDKGHYMQAAEIFETSMNNGDENPRTRTGAALCYLHLAAENLNEALVQEPDAQNLASDLKKIDDTIQLLNRTSWHTKWAGYKRGIHDEETSHLLVYDR